MPRDREIYYVMSAVENWEAETLIRMEGYSKNIVTCNAYVVKLFQKIIHARDCAT